jgi:neutral ceramidase
MTINAVLAMTGLVVVTVSGCGTIAGQLPVPQPQRPSGAFLAGVARVDITPAPGFPMGGHSKAGSIARGYWTRLFARAFVLEDAAGNTLVLVSCDLWSVPAGLVDRVAEILLTRAETHHIDRDHLVLAATHTHHSPGNFSTSAFYNTWASASVGFDARLFEFLAQRIAQAIVNAARARRPATLSHVVSPVNEVTRNRSLPAFLLNADRAEIDEGVDPRATALWIREAAAPERVLGVAVFVAMHPTLLGPATPVYSADIFGVAANYAERTLHVQSPEAVVGLFNGAEGDVSVVARHRDRSAALRLGERLGQSIVANPARERVDGAIRRGVTRQPMAGQCVDDEAICAADFPLFGAGALGGSESIHWLLSWLGWGEGVTGTGVPGHGAKRAALGTFGRLLMPSSGLPAEAPLAVHQVGGVLFVTLPGEFTTIMGRRVAAWVAEAAKWQPERVALVGLANEYLSYFATPEEYALQHYEGASTLWGPQAGPLLGRRLASLAATLSTPPRRSVPIDFHHRAGLAWAFTLANAGPLPHPPHAGLDALLGDAEHGKRRVTPATFCWDDVVPSMSAASRVTPEVTIVKRSGRGTFEPLLIDGIAEDDSGVNFVTVAGLASPGDRAEPRSEWCTIWLGATAATDTFHFRVHTLRGTVTSPPITRRSETWPHAWRDR